mgnify:CR=1 FL=1
MPQKESRREKFMDEMMVDFSDYNRDILAKSLSCVSKTSAYHKYLEICEGKPLGEFLGDGGFSWVETNGTVAFKIIPTGCDRLRRDISIKAYSEMTSLEVSRLKKLGEYDSCEKTNSTDINALRRSGFSVIGMKSAFPEGGMRYSAHGDLYNFLLFLKHKNNIIYSLTFMSQIGHIVESIVSAMMSVHDKGLCHGDIKPENILIAFNGRDFFHKPVFQVKLCDWGAGNEKTSGYFVLEQDGINLVKLSRQYKAYSQDHLYRIAQDVFSFISVIVDDMDFLLEVDFVKERLKNQVYYFNSFVTQLKHARYLKDGLGCWVSPSFIDLHKMHKSVSNRLLKPFEVENIYNVLEKFDERSLISNSQKEEYELFVLYCLLSLMLVNISESNFILQGLCLEECFNPSNVHQTREVVHGVVLHDYLSRHQYSCFNIYHSQSGSIRARQLTEDIESLITVDGVLHRVRSEIMFGDGGNRAGSLKTVLSENINLMESSLSGGFR